jgi:membrane protein YqaA with SNARE-associated domain
MQIADTKRGWLRHVEAWAQHRHGAWVLAAIAFADSSFLPIPPDFLLVPMVLVRPRRVYALSIICVVASSLGAVVGYLIGYGLWNAVGLPLVQMYGYTEQFAVYQRLVAEWGVWIIIGKAFTPIPFKIAAIAAGVAAMDPWAFMIAMIFGRALHFAMLAALLIWFGERVMALVVRFERPLAVVSVLVLVGLVAAFHFG